MKTIILKRSLLATAAIFSVAVVIPAAVNAQPARAQEAQTVQQSAQEAQTQSPERREAGLARLEDAKLKACQNREKAIQNIMTRHSARGTKQLEVFTKISDRTQAFYTEKGKTLSNYNALVVDAAAKKSAAEAAVETVKNGSTQFKCDGENPKAVVSSFRENLKSMNSALKEYKTAVKNLIVGVKSVQSTTTNESGTERIKE